MVSTILPSGKLMRNLTALSFACCLFMLGSCKNEVLDPVTPEPSQTDELVSYSNTIQPIFNQSCSGSGCHVGERTSGVNLSTFELAKNSVGDQYGTFIIAPGKPTAEDSPIMDKLLSSDPRNGSQMPLNNPGSLSQSELDAIFNWIDQGARNIN